MADVVFVLMIVAFFALAAGLVRFCDRVIGPGEESRRAEEPRVEELAA
jgi:hypothetical protein